MDVVVPGRQAAVQVDELSWRLGAGRVVRDDPAGRDEVEVGPHRLHVEVVGKGRVLWHAVSLAAPP